MTHVQIAQMLLQKRVRLNLETTAAQQRGKLRFDVREADTREQDHVRTFVVHVLRRILGVLRWWWWSFLGRRVLLLLWLLLRWWTILWRRYRDIDVVELRDIADDIPQRRLLGGRRQTFRMAILVGTRMHVSVGTDFQSFIALLLCAILQHVGLAFSFLCERNRFFTFRCHLRRRRGIMCDGGDRCRWNYTIRGCNGNVVLQLKMMNDFRHITTAMHLAQNTEIRPSDVASMLLQVRVVVAFTAECV
mmetsp:Transcript_21215/g.34091  ORF Transcript_21215/g.34091 Transcript_21215/m.34091 type:complete len:247 (-) Transcript_21215:103-843(-)